MSTSTVQTVEQPQSSPEVRVTTARTILEAEELRPWFVQLRPKNPDADLDYSLRVANALTTVIRPHITLLEKPDSTAILIVGRVEQRRPAGRLGRRPVHVLKVAFGGIVGAETEADCRLAGQTLRNAIDEPDIDAVSLPHLEVDSLLYNAVRSAVPRWRTDLLPTKHVHWRAQIPASIDAFLKARSSKTRSNMRYYRKKVRAEHGAELVVREFRDPDDIDQLCRDIEVVAATTYQRGMGVGYTGDALQTALMSLGSSQGWLRSWLLYIDGVPVAFWFGYAYEGAFWSFANAFRPEYSDLRIGQYLQMEGLECLCADSDIHWLDWGTGDAEYKRRFGDLAITEADVVLYGVSIRAFGLATRTLCASTARVARKRIASTQTGSRAKKLWRRRAQMRANARSG